VKISLKEEMQTLLIPLYGRAQMSKKGLFKDEDAENALAQLDYDFSTLHIKEKTQVMLSIRSQLIDNFTKQYLAEHPDCTVIYLGCGLDSRAKRLGFPAKHWYDIDYLQVIEIRRQLYVEKENYTYIPSSVTKWEWMDKIESNTNSTLVIAEGLLMYLNEQDIKTLLLKIRDKFKDTTLIFDAYSEVTAKQAKNHPSLKGTGATVQWGIDSPETLEALGDGISHIKTIYLTDDSAVESLPRGYRMMFRFAGKFKAAKEAHRIFVVKLISR
jgi:O-methyltransferase involved in polyketide biosynthesis